MSGTRPVRASRAKHIWELLQGFVSLKLRMRETNQCERKTQQPDCILCFAALDEFPVQFLRNSSVRIPFAVAKGMLLTSICSQRI